MNGNGNHAPRTAKSYQEMRPWDPASNSIPLKLDRPPSLRDNANAALFLVCDEVRVHVRGVPAGDQRREPRPDVSIIFPGDLGVCHGRPASCPRTGRQVTFGRVTG